MHVSTMEGSKGWWCGNSNENYFDYFPVRCDEHQHSWGVWLDTLLNGPTETVVLIGLTSEGSAHWKHRAMSVQFSEFTWRHQNSNKETTDSSRFLFSWGNTTPIVNTFIQTHLQRVLHRFAIKDASGEMAIVLGTFTYSRWQLLGLSYRLLLF